MKRISNPARVPTECRHHGGKTIRTTSQNKRDFSPLFFEVQVLICNLIFSCMQYFMSRYGGHGLIFGQGKASNSLLPEDQSIDNMLDNYAKEIIPNYFFISSYDAKPEWMGALKWNNFNKKPFKLGTLSHAFNEVLLQYSVSCVTDIYIFSHQYSNVFGVLIKTHKNSIKDVVPDYEAQYDYVLQVFIRSQEEPFLLKNRPGDIERILTILFYKMGLVYNDSIFEFTPSRTPLGKLISQSFCDNATTFLVDVDSDEKLSALLQEPPCYP